jgi:hypothetical protein
MNDTAATPSTGPTGPNTPEGKAISSRNSLKTGLFAAHDFIREDERQEYNEAVDDLYRELTPQGHLETSLVEEIVSATWRLRRCRILEAAGDTDDYDSLDRARSRAHNVIRRSLAELRKLQTERTIRFEIDHAGFPGVAESRQILAAVRAHRVIQANAAAPTTPASSFCKTPEPAPTRDSAPGHAAQAASAQAAPLPDYPPALPTPASSFCKNAPPVLDKAA